MVVEDSGVSGASLLRRVVCLSFVGRWEPEYYSVPLEVLGILTKILTVNVSFAQLGKETPFAPVDLQRLLEVAATRIEEVPVGSPITLHIVDETSY